MTFTPEVWAERRKGIGASEVPALLEASPWQSPMDVWLAKQPDYQPGEDTEAQKNGHRMEPVILSVFSQLSGLRVRPNREMVRDRHTGSRLFCTPDGYVKSKRLVQAKYVGPSMAQHWSSQDESWETAVPEYVIAQVQAECAATGAVGVFVATCIASIGGLTWPYWYVPADLEFGNQIREFVTDWYERHVVKNEPVSGTVADHANVSRWRIRTAAETPLVERTPEIDDIAARLLKAKAARSILNKEVEAAENLLYAALSGAGGVNGLVAVTKRKGSVSYKKAVEALCPGADLEPYRGESSPMLKWNKDARAILGLPETKQIEGGEDE